MTKAIEIVLVDDGLREHIEKNFPKYHFISSTTKCITSTEDLKAELNRDEFDEVCLGYNLNKNMKFLDTSMYRVKFINCKLDDTSFNELKWKKLELVLSDAEASPTANTCPP